MELDPTTFDSNLADFLAAWPVEKVKTMTVNQYADLSDHNSFCYWLEYGTRRLGAIGAISLNKFELWKPKEERDFKDNRFLADSVYAWNSRKGENREKAFLEIRRLIIEIITKSQNGEWGAIDNIPFHAIGKWKIAVLYSNKKLLPIYSKRALLAIAKGLGQEYTYGTNISILQKFILGNYKPNESIEDFAYRLYNTYASKKPKRKFYIIGSKYGDGKGNDIIPMINDFLENKCVAVGFLADIDFSEYMGAGSDVVNNLVAENWKEKKPVLYKIQKIFRLLSQLRPGDIIAVKSHGTFNHLTIIAYAEVVERDGSIYEHDEDNLGHRIHVEFLDSGFYKPMGCTYGETIHHLTPKKDREKFYKVFGWYVASDSDIDDTNIIEVEPEDDDSEQPGGEGPYNEKGEEPITRGPIASVTVNRIHNRIQNRFLKFLTEKYPDHKSVGERNRIDAKRETESEVYIYEIKPFESVYYCIREGIGQLFDYSHQCKTTKQINIIIVGPNEPGQDDAEFLNSIKKNLQIPFVYLAFDENQMTIKEF